MTRTTREVACLAWDLVPVVRHEERRGNLLLDHDPSTPLSIALAGASGPLQLDHRLGVEAVRAEFDLPRCVTAVHPERRRRSLGCSRAHVGVAGTGRAAPGATSWHRELQQHALPRRVFAARHGDFRGDLTTTAWQHLRVRAGGTDLLVRRASDDPFEVQSLHTSGGWVEAAYRLTVDLPRRGTVAEIALTPQEARRTAQRWREDVRLAVLPEDL